MKIVVFAPHPDDEVYGCGGSILKWMEEGHDMHIIYITDNRVLITWGLKDGSLIKEEIQEYIDMTEDQIAEIALKEACDAAKGFGFINENVHLLKIHDQDAINKIDLGIKLSKDIIKDSDRIVLPSNKNNHKDHQATHEIAKGAAKELNLENTEFYVYAIYNILRAPKEKQIKIKITKYRDKLYDIMKNYKTQLCFRDTRLGWETLTRKVTERFGIFTYEDIGKFVNF